MVNGVKVIDRKWNSECSYGVAAVNLTHSIVQLLSIRSTNYTQLLPYRDIQTYTRMHRNKVYVNLYSAFLRKAPQMRSYMDHTVLPANYTMPAFTPQPQNITALWLVLILPSHEG